MPVSGFGFIRARRIDLRIVLGIAIGGVPAVLLAALVVKSLPLVALRWGVVVVVLYAAFRVAAHGPFPRGGSARLGGQAPGDRVVRSRRHFTESILWAFYTSSTVSKSPEKGGAFKTYHDDGARLT